MKTVKLLSWHEDVMTKAASLKRRGLTIDSAPLIRTSAVVGELAHLNPAALVFDLDKLPSRSREIALALRSSRSANHIPILFAGGSPEKQNESALKIPTPFTPHGPKPRAPSPHFLLIHRSLQPSRHHATSRRHPC
ncbi:hypothetical protein RBB78_07160 [Tunturiibacter empetritectus]|uniref:hypothetical protein n=1 Tax=Tunturiibacter empetritectus TaxID=3069691 RepID=UPI003D9BA4C6